MLTPKARRMQLFGFVVILFVGINLQSCIASSLDISVCYGNVIEIVSCNKPGENKNQTTCSEQTPLYTTDVCYESNIKKDDKLASSLEFTKDENNRFKYTLYSSKSCDVGTVVHASTPCASTTYCSAWFHVSDKMIYGYIPDPVTSEECFNVLPTKPPRAGRIYGNFMSYSLIGALVVILIVVLVAIILYQRKRRKYNELVNSNSVEYNL